MDDQNSPPACLQIARISDPDRKTEPELPAKPAGPRRGRGAQDSGAPLPACRWCVRQTSSNRIQAPPESSVAPPAPCDLLAAAEQVAALSTLPLSRMLLPQRVCPAFAWPSLTARLPPTPARH